MQYVANRQVGGTVFTRRVLPKYNIVSAYNFTINMTRYYVYVVSLTCFVISYVLLWNECETLIMQLYELNIALSHAPKPDIFLLSIRTSMPSTIQCDFLLNSLSCDRRVIWWILLPFSIIHIRNTWQLHCILYNWQHSWLCWLKYPYASPMPTLFGCNSYSYSSSESPAFICEYIIGVNFSWSISGTSFWHLIKSGSGNAKVSDHNRFVVCEDTRLN